jgi:hypothetical protein
MPQSTPVLGALAQNQTHDLATHTAVAAHNATAPLIHGLTTAQQATTHAWLLATGSPNTPPTYTQATALAADARRRITAAMAGQAAHAQRITTSAATAASALGTHQASTFAQHAGATTAATPAPPLDAGTTAAVNALPQQVRQDHDAALAMLTAAALIATGLAAVTAAVNRAKRAAARIRALVSWAITAAVAQGVTAVTRALQHPGTATVLLMWVAEPGACPACQAYAGHTVKPGHLFPGGLTTNPGHNVYPEPIPGPPRHISCRCTLIPWSHAWQDPGQPPMAQILRDRATRP